MNRATITGRDGIVRWGAYATAATVGSWSLIAGPAGGTLTATLVSVDDFQVSQRPLKFVVTRPQGQPWCWPIESLQISGQTLTASLGPVE